MIVDQDAHAPHHLPNRSRHGSGTACHDRQALVPPWTPLAHAVAHSCSDGHQAQPEGLETIPSRSAQCWYLPREARSRLERSVEASIGHVSRAAGCHMPGSALAATARDQTSGGGAKYGKVLVRCLFSDGITKNRCSQPCFCTVGGKRQSGHINPATPVERGGPPPPEGMRSGIGGLVRAGPRGLLQFTRYLSVDFLLFGHPIISVRVTLRVQHDLRRVRGKSSTRRTQHWSRGPRSAAR